ncbi:hypothetical protein ADUPG1_012359, partial [Aduncisulcus paluster]
AYVVFNECMAHGSVEYFVRKSSHTYIVVMGRPSEADKVRSLKKKMVEFSNPKGKPYSFSMHFKPFGKRGSDDGRGRIGGGRSSSHSSSSPSKKWGDTIRISGCPVKWTETDVTRAFYNAFKEGVTPSTDDGTTPKYLPDVSCVGKGIFEFTLDEDDEDDGNPVDFANHFAGYVPQCSRDSPDAVKLIVQLKDLKKGTWIEWKEQRHDPKIQHCFTVVEPTKKSRKKPDIDSEPSDTYSDSPSPSPDDSSSDDDSSFVQGGSKGKQKSGKKKTSSKKTPDFAESFDPMDFSKKKSRKSKRVERENESSSEDESSDVVVKPSSKKQTKGTYDEESSSSEEPRKPISKSSHPKKAFDDDSESSEIPPPPSAGKKAKVHHHGHGHRKRKKSHK